MTSGDLNAARALARLGGMLVLLCSAALPQTRDFTLPAGGATLRVRLLAPLTTKFNRKGDMVSAAVVEPPELAGAILEGDVRDVKASAIQFEFHTLHAGPKTTPVTAWILDVSNSKRALGVDEDGTPLMGGRRAAIGNLARGDTPRLSAKSGPVSLASGSEMVLEVQPRKSR